MTAENTVLLILDLQKLNVGGGIAKLACIKGVTSEFKDFNESLKRAVENIRLLLKRSRQLEIKVIFTKIISKTGDATDIGPHTSIWDESFPYDPDDETLIIPKKKGELVLEKVCSNPFNCTNLEDILQNLDVKYIILCGVRTPGYLDSVSFDAADRGFGVIVVSNASVGGVPGGTSKLTGGLIRVRSIKQILEILENWEVNQS
jgi:nicotinamidase-related amidase